MSTNYYAKFQPNGEDDITLTLHIGKSSRGRISTLCGTYFPNRRAWADFLRHNDARTLTIVDEYGVEYTAEAFIADYLATPDTNQRKWLIDNGYTIHGVDDAETLRPRSGDYWVDEDGFLLYDGMFF